MGRLPKGFFVAAAGLTLAACTGFVLDRAQQTSPQGSPFQQALYSGYLELADVEFKEGDYTDSDFFARRAIQAGADGGVGPQDISQRRLPDDKIPELAFARRRLTVALEDGAAETAPAAAARAQVMFDCWIQEQEENFQDGDIASCRDRFLAALERVPQAATPGPESPNFPSVSRPLTRFVILFDFDDSAVVPVEQGTITRIVEEVARRGGAGVTIAGHTDRAGGVAYNNRLAERRVEAVGDALNRAGLTNAVVLYKYLGEREPAVRTNDGVREARNRRVEVLVE